MNPAHKIIVYTDRLYLRELVPDDAFSFYELNQDPDVLKYTGDKAFADVASAKTFLENYSQYKNYRLGRWAVMKKDDDSFLGWCGIRYSEEKKEHDLGFRFFKKFWNNGYASEAAKACVDIAFRDLNIPTLIGRAMKENIASIKVLENVGLGYVKDIDFDGRPGALYSLSKNDKNLI